MKTLKRVLLIFSICLIFSAQFIVNSQENTKYDLYQNEKFGFEMLFPKELGQTNLGPENSSGDYLISKDQQTHLSVWAKDNVPVLQWKDEYNQALLSLQDTQITYKLFKKNFFVISGFRGNQVIYWKEQPIYSSNKSFCLIFSMVFPVAEKKKWDPILTNCVNSIKKIQPSLNNQVEPTPNHVRHKPNSSNITTPSPTAIVNLKPKPQRTSPPSNFRVVVTKGMVFLTWDKPSNDYFYIIYHGDELQYKSYSHDSKICIGSVLELEKQKTIKWGIEAFANCTTSEIAIPLIEASVFSTMPLNSPQTIIQSIPVTINPNALIEAQLTAKSGYSVIKTIDINKGEFGFGGKLLVWSAPRMYSVLQLVTNDDHEIGVLKKDDNGRSNEKLEKLSLIKDKPSFFLFTNGNKDIDGWVLTCIVQISKRDFSYLSARDLIADRDRQISLLSGNDGHNFSDWRITLSNIQGNKDILAWDTFIPRGHEWDADDDNIGHVNEPTKTSYTRYHYDGNQWVIMVNLKEGYVGTSKTPQPLKGYFPDESYFPLSK
jgi:hypothetical protein